MKVIDASAMLDVLLGTTRAADVERHLDDDLFAPEALVGEVHNYVRRLDLERTFPLQHVHDIIDVFHRSPIEYLPIWHYSELMWTWRHSITSFDAHYVAAAAHLRCPLLTCDLRLAAAASREIDVIAVR
jgi:predicted nucleic acid-binding protein